MLKESWLFVDEGPVNLLEYVMTFKTQLMEVHELAKTIYTKGKYE